MDRELVMFWRRLKPQIGAKQVTVLSRLARRLGVERRYAPRVRYPRLPSVLLPQVSFERKWIAVNDISVGGCCLLDPAGLLGPNVGNDVHLVLHWSDGPVSVHGRIVSRVDHRRHIQFRNFPLGRAESLREALEYGVRGQSIKAMETEQHSGPAVLAREIWASPAGDSVTMVEDALLLAKIFVSGHEYSIRKDADKTWSVQEIARVSIFLCNIPRPSELLRALLSHVESLPRGEAF